MDDGVAAPDRLIERLEDGDRAVLPFVLAPSPEFGALAILDADFKPFCLAALPDLEELGQESDALRRGDVAVVLAIDLRDFIADTVPVLLVGPARQLQERLVCHHENATVLGLVLLANEFFDCSVDIVLVGRAVDADHAHVGEILPEVVVPLPEQFGRWLGKDDLGV
jgi:hypothetical protein